MKLTVFIGGLSGGGAERVVSNLSNYLSDRHTITILTMSDDKPAYKLNDNIERIPLYRKDEANNIIFKNIKRIYRFRKYIKKSLTDAYLVMLPMTTNIMLYHRKLIKVPIIVSERCDPYTRYKTSKFKRWIVKRLYPKADGFVFQTEDAMKYYDDIIGDKGIVIPNAINPEFVRAPYIGKRKKQIVSAGRLTEQKNFKLLIEVFANILKEYPEYYLSIYGDGHKRSELENYISLLDISERVKLPGYVNNFGSHIIDSSLFVLPSNYEGMPNALMEAMALGLPCISTDCPVGGPKYLIQDGVNGLLIERNNPKQLEIAINKMLSNNEYANELGCNAKKISQDLNSDKIYSKWESYILKFCKLS